MIELFERIGPCKIMWLNSSFTTIMLVAMGITGRSNMCHVTESVSTNGSMQIMACFFLQDTALILFVPFHMFHNCSRFKSCARHSQARHVPGLGDALSLSYSFFPVPGLVLVFHL